MRRFLLLWAIGALACSHVTKAEQEHVAKPDDGSAQPAKRTGPARAPALPRNIEGDSAKPQSERQGAGPGRPQLATSPDGVLLPDGPALIQEALEHRGYLANHRTRTLDEKTSDALQHFQADNDLPSTGAPDRDTIRKLGLAPRKVFRGPK